MPGKAEGNTWWRTHCQPLFQLFGYESPDDYKLAHIKNYCTHTDEVVHCLSLGTGTCDHEIRLLCALKEQGVTNVHIHCLEYSPILIETARKHAQNAGVLDALTWSQVDINTWQPERRYTVVFANQILHHLVALEDVCMHIHDALTDDGIFLVQDTIGRTGSQCWPETLVIVQEYWQQLPLSHRYNHQLERLEHTFRNWDCAQVGFEAVRSQDILPLLLQHFSCESFFPLGGIVDPFFSRSFGPNFDETSQWDTAFIDTIHIHNEALLRSGSIKPTQLIGGFRKQQYLCDTTSREGIVPAACIRRPDL